MSRLAARHTPRLESLEDRKLLSTGTSDLEQYALEQLNKARLNPAQAAVDVTTNLSPYSVKTFQYYKVDVAQTRDEIAATTAAAPLAWNEDLARAAEVHADDQAENGFQSHVGSDGTTLEDRLDRAGYTSRDAYSENVYAYADSVDQAMQAFLVDFGVSSKGHRKNLFNPDYKEVGVAVTPTRTKGVGPNVIVQNFGSESSSKAYLLGVVYNDRDGDQGYDIGEGTNRLTISVTKVVGNGSRAVGETVHVTPWASGGYQVALDPGQYKIVARDGDRVFRDELVNIGQDNVKIDFDLSDRWQGTPYSPPVIAPPAPQVVVNSTPAPPVVAEAPPVRPTVVAAPVQTLTNLQPTSPAERPAATRSIGFSWTNLSWRTWNGGQR